ncbi:DNA-directed RNA polymerase subunit beta' [Spiroplasma endosymbiont of Virgichneumon dumeticola]|uniref:DNA-directed RNA polymerase subunit beta' n=1 Tax=Spiroplasma endosymbiont of Virgichneumon dumeticola TaxID=3139323 RepID=UPI0035C8F362
MQKNSKHYTAIKISLASADQIRSWSHGEITKPETINYKSLKPEKDGLFDARIFGPTKNYECTCGKYKKIKNKGKVCERCLVEITEAIVRRERLGHIELEEPVTHIWMLKASPSRIALALDMKAKDLEEVAYFVSYIVLEPGTAKGLKQKMIMDLGNAKSSADTRNRLRKVFTQILDQLEPNSFAHTRAQMLTDTLSDTSRPFSMDECAQFITKHTGTKFGIGAAAIEFLLKNINLEKEFIAIKKQLLNKKSQTDRRKLMRRLDVIDSFAKSGNKPEWMVMHAIPVIPPDIRPIIQLDGGRFTTSEINDLYRRIIIRNERLKKVKQMGAPILIINNEKRMLQEAVDALFDNERKARPVTGRDKRPLKSLTSTLKGKQGRFRQNLLGKRVDYSGRSVIAVGPELKMYQCGIPRDMAIILFKPFVIQRLVHHELALNIKIAEKLIEVQDERIWDILEEVVKDRPVLLNRAPTLHRLGIQAFEVVLVKGKAIRLHPLVTPAFNADFDGDQMAVHVPITQEAVAEARSLMLGSKNILSPKDGKPIVTPTQDMVLGNYYLTIEKMDELGQGIIFKDINEAVKAYDTKTVSLHAIIGIRVSSLGKNKFAEVDQNKFLITTIGKIIFNQIFSSRMPFINRPNITNLTEIHTEDLVMPDADFREFVKTRSIVEPFKKKNLADVIHKYFKIFGTQPTAEMLDKMKNLGFKFSTISGTTISAGDVVSYSGKTRLFSEADQYVKDINKFYKDGMLTNRERHYHIINKWGTIKNIIQDELETVLKKDINNPIFMMWDSGARTNISNFTQLVGMRGLMNNPKGEVIELPIKSSFREGLNVSEFFISTHGARKGMADMALKTSDSGYLTRRLVDVSQDIIVTEFDCKTGNGFIISDIVDLKRNNIIVPLHDRLFGRYVQGDVVDANNNVIVPNNELITEKLVEAILQAKVEKLNIRSVLTCEAGYGVCQKCYGVNLTTGEIVAIGEAVGIIAAQSIGEPGTQLTMRTFHTGGVAGGSDITQGLPRIKELLDVTNPKGAVAIISEFEGKITEIREEQGIYTIAVKSKLDYKEYKTQYNAQLRIKTGDTVKIGQKLTEGAINIIQLLEVAGIIEVQQYILKEVQRVYRLQGIEISDKYIEIIVKQMLNRIFIFEGGDSSLLPGEIVDIKEFKQVNAKIIYAGKTPAFGRPLILGIKKAPLESDSFLAAASFQDTTRVLTNAVIKSKTDNLRGLKENVILGNLIPAGTGLMTTEQLLENGRDAREEEY